MKIIELRAENIKRIKAVEIRPQGNMVVIEGKNEQGKSSIMDSIAWVLGGAKLVDSKPIRNGQKKAEISVEIGPYVITRTFTQKGTYLKVANKDGLTAQKAQTFLDDKIGELSFDPLAFITKSNQERLEILKKCVGISFDEENAKYGGVFEKRTLMNRDLDRVKKELETYQEIPDLKEVRVLADINKDYNDAKEFNREIENAIEEIVDINDMIRDKQKSIKEYQQKIIELNNQVEKLQESRVKYEELSKTSPKDLLPIEKEMEEAQQVGEIQYKITRKSELEEQEKKLSKKTEKMTGELNQIKQKKQEMIEKAKMPVKGLDIREDDVYYKKIPFSQVSQSEQIEVSMAIAIAQNPKVKIVRIMDGSLLDADKMKKIEEIANKHDFQIWIERVADEKTKGAIYIEDGEVK